MNIRSTGNSKLPFIVNVWVNCLCVPCDGQGTWLGCIPASHPNNHWDTSSTPASTIRTKQWLTEIGWMNGRWWIQTLGNGFSIDWNKKSDSMNKASKRVGAQRASARETERWIERGQCWETLLWNEASGATGNGKCIPNLQCLYLISLYYPTTVWP